MDRELAGAKENLGAVEREGNKPRINYAAGVPIAPNAITKECARCRKDKSIHLFGSDKSKAAKVYTAKTVQVLCAKKATD